LITPFPKLSSCTWSQARPSLEIQTDAPPSWNPLAMKPGPAATTASMRWSGGNAFAIVHDCPSVDHQAATWNVSSRYGNCPTSTNVSPDRAIIVGGSLSGLRPVGSSACQRIDSVFGTAVPRWAAERA
jgi:hypothetical protein